MQVLLRPEVISMQDAVVMRRALLASEVISIQDGAGSNGNVTG